MCGSWDVGGSDLVLFLLVCSGVFPGVFGALSCGKVNKTALNFLVRAALCSSLFATAGLDLFNCYQQ